MRKLSEINRQYYTQNRQYCSDLCCRHINYKLVSTKNDVDKYEERTKHGKNLVTISIMKRHPYLFTKEALKKIN